MTNLVSILKTYAIISLVKVNFCLIVLLITILCIFLFVSDSTEVLEQLNGLMVPGNWSQSRLFERDNRNGYREPPTSPVNRCDGNSKLGGGKTTYDYEEDTDYDSDSDEDCNFKIAWHKYVVQKAQMGLELCENGNYGVQSNHLEKPLQELNDDEEMGDTAVGNSAVLSNEVLEMELELMELFNAMQIQD